MRIEEELEEVVAEVVVRADVAAAACPGVAPQGVKELAQRRREACPARIDAVKDLAVPHQQTHEACQVVRGPMARHVGLSGADTAAEDGFGIKKRVVNPHRDIQTRTRDSESPFAAVHFHQPQPSVLQ